jgi:hypothetical protein
VKACNKEIVLQFEMEAPYNKHSTHTLPLMLVPAGKRSPFDVPRTPEKFGRTVAACIPPSHLSIAIFRRYSAIFLPAVVTTAISERARARAWLGTFHNYGVARARVARARTPH